DLLVVGEEEQLAQLRAERPQDPLAEIGRHAPPCHGRPLHPPHRPLAVEGIEAVEVVLEWVGDEPPLDPHPRFPLVMEPRVPERAVAERVVVGVAAELDVSAHVPGEALRVDEARGEPARPVGLLEHEVGVVPELMEADGGPEAGRAGAEYHDPADVLHRSPPCTRVRRATRTVSTSDRAAARQSRSRTMLLPPTRRPRFGTGTSTIRSPARTASPLRMTFGANASRGTGGSSAGRADRR